MSLQPALRTRISVSVSDSELSEFTRAITELNIAEGALGHPENQALLRSLISGIFRNIGPAIDADKSLGTPNCTFTGADYCVITGMRFHELPYALEQDVRGAFVVGLSSYWGNPSLGNYHQPNARFAYRHIKARPIEAGEPESLLNSTRDGFPHTDSAFKRKPEPVFALFTVRAAKDGGDTLVWDVRQLVSWIAAQPNGATALAIMRERTLPFVGSILTPDQVIHEPILLDASGERMRYKRDAIEDAAKALGRGVSSDERLVMDMIDAAAECPDLTVRFALEDGDAVILDNQRTLHSRTPFTDEKRHLLKTTMVH
ncbi:TauD/TfdA family dioxygenase [Bradyrhizobium sp.]